MVNIGISILIPLYNGIEYLEEAIVSVINQTYKKWEIIIGINGHEPNSLIEAKSLEIKHKYEEYDIRVIYYNTKGKTETLNKMIDDIKYDYVALLDADDVWFETKLEKQIPYILSGYDVIGTQCQYIGDMNIIPSIPVNDISNYNIFCGNPIINSSVIIKKCDAFWDDPSFVRGYGLEDYSMWFKFYYQKKKFYNVPEVLCYHRIHCGSAFNKINNYYLNDLINDWYIIYNRN